MKLHYWIALLLIAAGVTAAALAIVFSDISPLKAKACFDYAKVVHVLGCGGRDPAMRYGGGYTWCEVIVADGAIVKVPSQYAIVGSTVCLDERTEP